LLVFIPVIILLAFLYVIGYKATALQREATRFGETTSSIAGQSNFLGKQFRAALNASSKSKFLNESLNNMVDQALSLSQRAEAIDAPQDLKLAQSFFAVSMKLRHQGLEKYSRSLITAISSAQHKTSTKAALNDINLSDVAYSYFLQETRRYFSSNNLKIALKKSAFLTGDSSKHLVAAKAEKKPAEKEKEKKPGEEPDISVEDVATDPLRISFNPDNDTRVLPDASEIDVRIEVSNKGKSDEKDIPVEVYLYNKGKFTAKKRSVIDNIKAGERARLTVKGFEPKKEGLNTFKIKAGPLVSEKNEEDNTYTYKFIFKSQDSSANSE
jgi:uncharacterized protein (UPF0248 family)